MRISRPFRNFALVISFILPLQSAFALQCPKTQSDYTNLLASLNDFQSKLGQRPECQSLANEIQGLSYYFSRENRELIERATGGLITGSDKREIPSEDLIQLQNYSQNVTQKILRVVQSLQSQNSCREVASPSFLSVFSTLTGEVTQIASQFSGPYAVPLSIGGSVVAGILSGIDAIFQANRSLYDFEKSSEARQLYTSNLCIFHDIRAEVDSILMPATRLSLIDTLIENLDEKKEKLLPESPLAGQFLENYNVRRSFLPALNRARNELTRLYNSDDLLDEYEVCEELAHLAYDEESPFIQMLSRYNGPFSDHANELKEQFETAKTREHEVLDYESCLNSNLDPNALTLSHINRRSMNRMRHIIRAMDREYARAQRVLLMAGQSEEKPSGSHTRTNFVDWMKGTMLKLEWAYVEQQRFQRLIQPGSEDARLELQATTRELEDRFAYHLEPQYLDFRLDEGMSARKELVKKRRDISRFVERLAELTRNPEQAKDAELFTHALSYFDVSRIIDHFEKVTITVDLIDNRCAYFAKANLYSSKVRYECESHDLRELKETKETFGRLLLKLQEYLSWCHEHNVIAQDHIESIIARIESCHETIGLDPDDPRAVP